ncbi:hypothetical protein JR316_0002750 [Psilocybe cubensis]|uniref:Uncharacterized protein n=2 Tax=Psilocybe cubensis TaxID=181762 RepID=A0ACB8HDN5_PSICU|nr:hypothetical protein JR316_0002750 [Psilocybe cubensis]KAH9485835.1 hypothetical protein JR316_0002750 [Psilocybe cubensis]
MAGYFMDAALILAGVISAFEDEHNKERKDRAHDLAHSLQDISERIHSTYTSVLDLLSKGSSDIAIWKAAISDKGIQTINKEIKYFEEFQVPNMNITESNIFLMRKLELRTQGFLTSIKSTLPPVAEIKAAMGTFDDLVKNGEITKEKAEQGKQKVLAEYHGIDIQLPSLPSNRSIYDELHQRDVTTKVYMGGDPSFEDTEKWVISIEDGSAK